MNDIFDENNNLNKIYEEPKPVEYKKYPKWLVVLVVVLIIAAITVSMLVGISIGKKNSISSDLPMLNEAYEYIKNYYYEYADLSREDFDAMVTSGMLSSLDRFSWLNDLQVENALNYMSGFSMRADDYHKYYVSDVIPNAPANKSYATKYYDNSWTLQKELKESDNVKIEIGDRIYAYSVNGENPVLLEGASMPAYDSPFMTAKEITLYIVKLGEDDKPLDGLYQFDIKKDLLNHFKYSEYYSAEQLNSEKTGMIKFRAFETESPIDFLESVNSFLEDPKKPNKLILDLRNNGGGSLAVAQFMLGSLLKGADQKDYDITLLDNRVKDKVKKTLFKSSMTYRYEENGSVAEKSAINLPSKVEDFELVILINGFSASASELVSAVMNYYDNVQVVGMTSYGKGVAQNHFTFTKDKNYYFTLVTGYYYVPRHDANGNFEWYTLHGKGITPEGDNYISDDSNGLISKLNLRPLRRDKYVERALTILEG